MCHEAEYDSWAKTRHASALESARAARTWAFSDACLPCHATNRDERLGGVQCEACHGPGSEYRSVAIMKDRAKAVAAGLEVPTQATCDLCHDGREHHVKVGFNRNVHAHEE